MIMNATTLKALKESIKHWKRLSTKRMEREWIGPDHCALCGLFWRQTPRCKGCPVSELSGSTLCQKTPYSEVLKVIKFGLDSHEFKEAAKEELKFLKSLLPKKNKPKIKKT